MKPLNASPESMTLENLFKKFKEKKWGMHNFFKMDEIEYEIFNREIDLLYKGYASLCSDPEKVKLLGENITHLKKSIDEVRKKEIQSNGVSLKIYLRNFDDHIRELLVQTSPKKNKY